VKILFYISGYDGCGYYRVQMVAKYLNKLPNITAKISSQYDNNEIKKADIIVVQKQTNPKALPYIRYARSIGKKVISECDDDYFNIPTWNPAYQYYKNLGNELISFYTLSNAMTVTTNFLKNQLIKYNPNIYVTPNSIDFETQDSFGKMSEVELKQFTRYMDMNQNDLPHSEVKEFLKDKITIGWGGSPTHFRDLNQTTEALSLICKENKNVVLVMLACCTDTLMKKVDPKQMILIKPVPIFRYHQVLASMKWDIGICPIEDNVFNKSKSNLKFLEFSINGYPCICSDVENYSSSIIHGENGFLSKNDTQSWYENITRLIYYPELREIISNNAKKFVRENYNISKNILMWYDAYKEVLGG